MKAKVIVLDTQRSKENCSKFITELDTSEKKTVTIRDYKLKRSVAQNRLYRGWMSDASQTDINEFAGWTPHEWHIEMKRMFLMPMYEETYDDIAELLETIREVWRQGMKQKAQDLVDFILGKTTPEAIITTKRATVEQFTEYLTHVEQFCHGHGVLLRTDNEFYQLAMGKKK
jgi:hypothetical protein